jgi:hypothetical protein
MECAECGVRSAVGYCGECETLLCEVCGRTCSQCGKIACRSHLQRTSSGRNICVSCVVLHYDKRARQSKERRERRAEEVAMGGKTRKHHKHAAEPENLSFEALAREIGPLAAPIPEYRDEDPERSDNESGRPQIVVNRGPLADADALNARVLTGSANTRTPPWLGGLSMGVISWILCFAARGQSESALEDGILNGVALLISFGTVVWTAPGAFSKEATSARTWCRVALMVGLGALVFAGLLGAARWL